MSIPEQRPTDYVSHTDWLLAQLGATLHRASKLYAEVVDALARPPVDMLAPAYWPERMGYLSELRVGDRVLFAGGWRQVRTRNEPTSDNGTVAVTFTDPDMDALVDKGTHAIRIQKRADEQQTDALHRRDTAGL